MYPIVYERISYLKENRRGRRRRKRAKIEKDSIASRICITLFFFFFLRLLSKCMYLIIIKSSSNYYIYTQSSSLHTMGAKLQKRILSLPLSSGQHCCFGIYRFYDYYFFYTLSPSPFPSLLAHCGSSCQDDWIFFFPPPPPLLLLLSVSRLLLFSLSMLTLFAINRRTALLTDSCKRQGADERTFRVIACKKRRRRRRRRGKN